MKDSANISCFAVDGGGTHCRFVLMHGGQRFAATGGTANVSTDFAAACSVLVAGIDALSREADLPVETICSFPGFIGVAGMTGPAMRSRMSEALPFERARYADDRPAALRGALGPGDGFVAHCGTGSFFASQIDGKQHLTGGWGSILGDEASAMWVGKQLLSRTLRAVDGLAKHSELSHEILAEFGNAPGIVRFAATAKPDAFGTLARKVTAALQRHDPIARRLMEDAAAYVAAEFTALGWHPGQTLCLTGGIARHYGEFLPDAMRDDLRAPLGEPIDGAVALARAYAGETER